MHLQLVVKTSHSYAGHVDPGSTLNSDKMMPYFGNFTSCNATVSTVRKISMASYLTSLKGGEQKKGEKREWGKRGREERKRGRGGGGREKRSSVCKEDQFTVPSPHQRGCNFDHHPTSHLDRVRT